MPPLSLNVVRSVVAGVLLGLVLPPLAQAQPGQQTFVVESRGDGRDANPGDGNCATQVTLFGQSEANSECTLRAAIEEANADADRDSISFENIPTTNGFATILLDDSLGTLEVDEEIGIDGSTAPGYPSASANGPIVKVDGSNIDGDILDIGLGTDGSRIVGLAFVNGAGEGIEVSPDGSVENVSILDCFIGIDVDGTTVQGNLRNPDEFGDTAGISIVGTNGSRIVGNLVSGNHGDGILISGNNNTVTNNIIGLDHDRDAAKGNTGNGVRIARGTGNSIGGTTTNTFGVVVATPNTIAANGEAGVLVNGDDNNVLTNRIGTNGSSAFPNSNGVVIEGRTTFQGGIDPAKNNTIGGVFLFVDPGNTISGNQFNGIRLGNGANNLSADSNSVLNNNIGTDASGTSAVPNGNGSVEGGIRIDEGTGNEILNNVIAGNNAHGIRVRGPSPSNVILGNRIGVDANGNPLGNNFRGIWIQTDDNVIGGSNSGDENTVGSNSFAGILVEGNSNSVDGNFVGTDSTGADIGNGANGIAVLGDNNGIDGNTVGNNSSAGILVRDASNNDIFGNYVGTNADGDSAPNGSEGVLIFPTSGNSSNDNVVGSSDAANVIAKNLGDGIRIGGDGSAIRNSVRFNQIFNNTNLGIDLGGDGTTANDAGDGDDGPNRLQNFPVFQDSEYDPDTDEVTVTYRVPSDPSEVNLQYPLTIDFYVADGDDEEGSVYLGTDTYSSVDPDDYGGCGSPPCTVTTTFTPQSSVGQDDDIVATATDGEGNTSEFSSSVAVEPVNDPPVARVDSFSTDEDQTLTVDAPGVLGNDTDPDQDALTASLVSGVSDGTLTLNGDGSFEYAPNQDFTGEDRFTYEAADGRGGTDQAEATITVESVNDPPVASDDSDETTEDQSTTTDVLANDSDPDGNLDASTVQVQSGPSNGSATVNKDGTITYAPDEGFTGDDSYTYTVADDGGAESNEAEVTITVAVSVFSIAGTIHYYDGDQIPVPNTDLQLEGDTSETVSTGSDGSFLFDNIVPGDYTLTPSRDASSADRGITVLDLVLTRRDILGLEPLGGPYRRIAADANASGGISTLDIALARRVILGLSTSLPEGFWRFVPADHNFDDPANPWDAPSMRSYTDLSQEVQNQNFTGAKRGDVNGSWTGSSSATAAAQDSTKAPRRSVELSVGSRAVSLGDTTRVPVRAEAFQGVAGIQFTLRWDPDRLSFVDAENYRLRGLGPKNLGTSRAGEGTLTMAWADPKGRPQSLSSGELLVDLRFRVKKSGDAEITFVSDPTPPRAYGGSPLAPMSFVRTKAMLNVREKPDAFRFAPNHPNPARTRTTFEYALPEAKHVMMVIYDLLGQVVATPIEEARQAGRHTVTVDVSDLASGVYVVHFRAGPFTSTQKMIVAQ